MNTYLTTLLLSTMAFGVFAQPAPDRKLAGGQRKYDLIVNQHNDTLTFNRGLRALKTRRAHGENRSILTDLASGYLSLGTSTVLSASQNLLGAGIGLAKEALRDKRPDWQAATMGECRFVKHLPMVTDVLDFYAAPSPLGAFDPTGMKFSGFGCRQYITVLDSAGKSHDEEVFYLSCTLRDDDHGLDRMLHHSKFEVVVDELRFNPLLCNLPNDSLSMDPSTRIGFSFEKRKDLRFNVEAVVKSSWVNEAIQVADNVELGRFRITACIDPNHLDSDGVFRYSRSEDARGPKRVVVTGDCFLVPRSYVGSTDMATYSPSWGTGQYRVEMDITETCSINEDYYTTVEKGKRRWNKSRWQPEWNLMKKRSRPAPGASSSLAEMLFPQFTGDTWITTLAEPVVTVLMTEEGRLLNAASQDFATRIGLTLPTPSATSGQQAAAAPSGAPSANAAPSVSGGATVAPSGSR
ncbi:MAG: hypothetical protein HDR80_06490 [Bacteroides sp.]|nr:hypothetical protein [Bacteroides sp.]